MTEGLKRCYGLGHLHFITFSCERRLAFLNSAVAREILIEELGRVRDERDFKLAGYVVMPEHVHLLIGEPVKGTISTVLQMLKQRVSRRMNAMKGRRSAPFWEKRFYDFNVYSDGKKSEKLNYMHANPVKRKLVEHPKDWPWSSWSVYRGGVAGLIRIDF